MNNLQIELSKCEAAAIEASVVLKALEAAARVAATEAAAALKAKDTVAQDAEAKAAALLKAKQGAAEEIAELESQMKEEKSKHRWIIAIMLL